MRKKTVKQLLYLCFVIVIYACGTPEYLLEEDIHKHRHFKVQNYTLKEAMNITNFRVSNQKVSESVKSTRKSNSNNREVLQSLIDESAPIKEITYDDKTSYTMLLDKETFDQNYFENLVIEIKSNDTISAYLVKYTPTEMTFNYEHQSYNFSGTTETSKVYGITSFYGSDPIYNDDGHLVSPGGDSGGGSIICLDVLKCNRTSGGGIGTIHNAAPGCYNTFTVRECSSNPYWNPWASSGVVVLIMEMRVKTEKLNLMADMALVQAVMIVTCQ